MGAMDLLKSERGIMNLVFLGVLAVLLFTGADKSMIDTWAMYAGGSVGLYTVAKSLKPNDEPKPGVEITRTETAEAGTDVLK